MKNIMDKNISAFQYQEAIETQFQSICEPLFSLGIKWFGYIKIFPGGSYLHVSPGHKKLVRQFFSTIKSQGSSATQEIESSFVGQSHYTLYSSEPIKKMDPVLHLLYSFGVWPIFVIHKNRAEFLEAYAFGTNIYPFNLKIPY